MFLKQAGDRHWADANASVADSMFLATIWFRENNFDCAPEHLLKYAELVLRAKSAFEAVEAEQEPSCVFQGSGKR